MQELPERETRQKTKKILGKTGKTRVKMYKFSNFFILTPLIASPGLIARLCRGMHERMRSSSAPYPKSS